MLAALHGRERTGRGQLVEILMTDTLLAFNLPPMRMSAGPAKIRRHPPLLGEHSAERLAELGHSPEDIVKLAAGGVGSSHRPGGRARERARDQHEDER